MGFEARAVMAPKVHARNRFGQFMSHLDMAAGHTMEDVANEGVALAMALAPEGHKPDKRTRPISASFVKEVTRTTAQWGNTARHTLPQETGSKRHPISGQVRFFWEKEGRWWNPSSNIIDHPGNPPHPFLVPSYREVMRRFMSIARRHY
jgi:hypothetical protein